MSLSVRSIALLTFVAACNLAGCSIFSKPTSAENASSPTQQESAPTPSASSPTSEQVASVIPVVKVAEPVKSEPIPPARPLPEPTALAPTVSAGTQAAQSSATLVHGFYINVGLFAVPANATKAFQKLEQAGLPVFSDVSESKKGKLTRVRVGPFSSRTQADTAAKKIHGLKLEALVFQH